MIAVSSLEDERLLPYRWVAQPERLEARGLFVAEGRLVVPRLLAAAAGPGPFAGHALSVLLSPAAADQMGPTLAHHPDVPAFVVPQAAMNAVVGFNIHRGCLALGRRPPVAALSSATLGAAARVIVLEGVNNPDNVGGIFRSAAALGADLVVLGPGCGDPLYRKAVRTSMGATLEVPYLSAGPWPAALDLLRSEGLSLAALTTDGEAMPLSRWRPGRRVAILAGAEGEGLSSAALHLAERRVTIPMSGGVDSLNVGTAVAVALYHVSSVERPS